MDKRMDVSPCAHCAQRKCRSRCAAWESWFCRRWKRMRQLWGVE